MANNSRSNILLSALQQTTRARLLPHCERVDLRIGTVLAEPHTPLKYAYFPDEAMVSLVSVTSEGATIEIAMIGSEGMVGIAGLLDVESPSYRAVVQVPGGAFRIAINTLQAIFDTDMVLRRLLLRYLHALLMQLAQSAVCSRFHSVEQRLARWLLASRDRVQSDTFPYTQEFLSHMLGTDRSTVALAAGVLKRAGLINYTRGMITMVNPKELEEVACECYQILRQEFQQLAKLRNL
jgi:CRP-like cAMP-binding protein